MRLLLPLFFFAASVSAQIPNSGFESWTGGDPDSWSTTNAPAAGMVTITKSATAYKGTGAVKGEVISFFGNAMGPLLQSGSGGTGFAYTSRSGVVQGYYQFSPQGGDEFAVNVILYKGGVTGTPVAVAAQHLAGLKTAYTQFSVPFHYLTGDTPDICVAQFLIYNPSNTLHAGSYFLLDELSMSGTPSAVETNGLHTPASFELKQNYPNPFNPSTTIAYDIPASGRVTMTVYDRLGTEVAVLLDRNEEAGSHTVRFDAAGRASGVYFVALRQGGMNAVRPMLLLK